MAARDTSDPQVARICQEMVEIRSVDHEELHRALIQAGEKPDDNGLFMTVVLETVVSVRSALQGISKKAPFVGCSLRCNP